MFSDWQCYSSPARTYNIGLYTLKIMYTFVQVVTRGKYNHICALLLQCARKMYYYLYVDAIMCTRYYLLFIFTSVASSAKDICAVP